MVMVLESDWIWKYSNKIAKHVKLSLFQVMQIEYKIQIQFWNLSRHSGWLWSQMRFSNEGNCVAFNRYVRKKKLFFFLFTPMWIAHSHSHFLTYCSDKLSWHTNLPNIFHRMQFLWHCCDTNTYTKYLYSLFFFCVLSVKWMKQQAKASKSVK